MTAAPFNVRLAGSADAEPVHAIYAPIVRDTAISFEWEVPTVEEIRRRIETVLGEGFPWLVAEVEGAVVGYAYASAFRARAAYGWTAETSIYVASTRHRTGIGRGLYPRLLEVLELQGYRSVYGVATAPNPASEGLHRSLGFELVGRFPGVGYKFGAWHDALCWHRPLGRRDGPVRAIRPVSEVLREAALG